MLTNASIYLKILVFVHLYILRFLVLIQIKLKITEEIIKSVIILKRSIKISDQIKLVGVVSLTSWDPEAERGILRDVSYNVWQQSMNKLRNNNYKDLVCTVTELRKIK